jgi:hypothetical protein
MEQACKENIKQEDSEQRNRAQLTSAQWGRAVQLLSATTLPLVGGLCLFRAHEFTVHWPRFHIISLSNDIAFGVVEHLDGGSVAGRLERGTWRDC